MRKARVSKKILSMLLCTAITCGVLLPQFSLTMAADGDSCSSNGCTGTFSNGFCTVNSSHYETPVADSSGTYQIANAGQLYWFADHVNDGNNSENAVLTADIVDNVSVLDGDKNLNGDGSSFRTWTPIGTYTYLSFISSKSYTGSFNGQGHTISGLYNGNSDSYVGLFGCIEGNTVQNVGIKDSYFTGSYLGGIVGYNDGGTVISCYNKATLNGSQRVGGVVGYNVSGTVEDCYNSGKITSSFYGGAIVGRASSGTVNNCFYLSGTASGGVNSSDTAGQTDVKTAEQFASGEVAYLLQKGNSTLVWGQMSNVSGSEPILTANELYSVARFGNDSSGTMGYSVASLGDMNTDRNIDIEDYQVIVNTLVSEENTEETAPDRIMFVRSDINGDGVVDALDANKIWCAYFGWQKLDIYAPWDFDGDGTVEDSDRSSIRQYISNGYNLTKAQKFACDINSDTYQDDIDLVQGFHVNADKYHVFFDTKYGEYDRNYFDLYIPKDKNVVGVVLWLHGGAWLGGDKSEFYGRLEEFAAKGYAGLAVNYRYICDDVNLDDIMDDIQNAVALAKEMGDSLGIELSGFLSTGGSAGGHLALHYAYSRADVSAIPPKAVAAYCPPTDLTDDYYFYNEELGCYNGLSPEGYDTTEEILSWACGQEFTYETRADAAEALKFVSPLYYVDENTVPTIINHGMKDNIVPFRNSVALDEKLTEYGIPHVFNQYPNSDHGLSSDAENMAYSEQLLHEYVETYLDSE